jgi:Protein of unknown function (DUF1579)
LTAFTGESSISACKSFELREEERLKKRRDDMKRAPIVVFAVLLFSTLLAVTQTPPQMPKPGPEHKNLAYFAGTWKLAGDIKPGPMGPGGKFTGTERIEWMPGGFFLVSHSQGSSPMGKETGLAVYGYDADKKGYTYDEFSSTGENIHATGTFDGKVWTWSSESPMGGKPMKGHFIVTETSPTSYAFKLEVSQDGNNWAPVMDGIGTKGATAKKKE